MPNIIDLTNQRFGNLTVIRDEKKVILDEAESLNRHGDTLQELKDIADETGDTTIFKRFNNTSCY